MKPSFINGVSSSLELTKARMYESADFATDAERTKFSCVVGSLEWLVNQTKPDLELETNQLQKITGGLMVGIS